MAKILVLNSGLNGEHSQSNQLTKMFIDSRAANGFEDNVVIKDLAQNSLPHLTDKEMQAWMTDVNEQTPEQQALSALSDNLIDQLFEVDTLVIGMPMYNMGVPSTFKAYIDRIARAGKTFRYTANGPEGLVKNLKVVILAARGGQYQGTPLDNQTGYLTAIFGLMGVTNIEFIYAEGLNMGEDIAKQAIANAQKSMLTTKV